MDSLLRSMLKDGLEVVCRDEEVDESELADTASTRFPSTDKGKRTVVDRISIVKLVEQDRIGRKSSDRMEEEDRERSGLKKEEIVSSSVGAEKAERQGEKEALKLTSS